MFPVTPRYSPSLKQGIFFFLFIIGLISFFVIYLETVPHIPIIIGIFVLLAYGLLHKVSFKDLEAAMVSGATAGMGLYSYFS